MLAITVIVSLLITFVIKRLFFTWKAKSIENKHIVVTGGSSGIGKAIAILAAKQGAHVTLIARNSRKLSVAQTEVRQACINPRQRVQTLALDVSDFDIVFQKLMQLEETAPPIFMLVNCAGVATCGKLEDVSPNDIKNLMNINYLGTVYPIKAVLPKMKYRKDGIIVITASQAALFGIYGMAAYSASKYALRGFAEAIDMEVNPYNISVTVALPADTDTPGFENENKSKPSETMLICENGGLYHPNDVAKKIMADALKGKFFSSLGFNSFMLSNLCVGMTRFSSISELIFQILMLGPLRFISSLYSWYFYAITKRFVRNQMTR